jgi:D-alanyl-D-alanine dipeptidase
MKDFIKLVFVLICLLIYSCNNPTPFLKETKSNNEVVIKEKTALPQCDSSELEIYFISKNLIDIASIDTSIQVSLQYSTAHNFLKKPIYDGLKKCYLPLEVAEKLKNAQKFLKQDFPFYSLIVFDAARPLSIQKKMWNELDIPNNIKINYLANPNDISLHNYGAAVDVGIIGENHVLLEMGTSFDFFGELSEPKKEKMFYKNGKLTKEAYANRLLLRGIMTKAGFFSITSEWWHFNYTTKKIASSKFQLIE